MKDPAHVSAPHRRSERPRILVSEPDEFPVAGLAALRAVGEVDLRQVPRAGLAEAFAEYDAILVRLAHRIDADALGASPRCTLLGVPTTGLDHIDLAGCRSRGIRVISLRDETTFLRTVRGTAEHTVGLTLALLRGIVPAVAAVKNGAWDRDTFRGHEIDGTAVGIVGMGRIGAMVAEIYTVMGARLYGYDRRPGCELPGVTRCTDMGSLCAACSVLSVHVSFDAGDAPVVAAAALAALPRGAFLVNTSRGGALDEVAVVEALESGRLAGVAADVVVGEPDATASPLVSAARRHTNIIITPHVGGNTYESRGRAETVIAERVASALRLSS